VVRRRFKSTRPAAVAERAEQGIENSWCEPVLANSGSEPKRKAVGPESGDSCGEAFGCCGSPEGDFRVSSGSDASPVVPRTVPPATSVARRINSCPAFDVR